jgi:hypothetical protein
MGTDVQRDKGLTPPKQGDTFRCKGCGMELQVTRDCRCKERDQVHFHCCGTEMVKV